MGPPFGDFVSVIYTLEFTSHVNLVAYLFSVSDENISKLPDESEPEQPQTTSMASIVGAAGEQTTLINNEEEAFALPPLDATIFPGMKKDCEFEFLRNSIVYSLSPLVVNSASLFCGTLEYILLSI